MRSARHDALEHSGDLDEAAGARLSAVAPDAPSLFVAYDVLLRRLEDDDWRRWPIAGRLDRVLVALSPVRWLGRQLVVDHVARTTEALQRSQARRAALLAQPAAHAAARDALGMFAESLPNVPRRALVTAHLVAVFGVAFVLANYVFGSRAHAGGLGDVTLGLVTADRGRIVDAAEGFDLRQTLGAAFLLAAATFITLLPAAAGDRIRRALLDESLERRVFATAGRSAPRGLRVEQWFRLASLALAVWAAFVLVVWALLTDETLFTRFLVGGVGLVLAALVAVEIRPIRRGPARAARRVLWWATAAAAAAALFVVALTETSHGPPVPVAAALTIGETRRNVMYRDYLARLSLPAGGIVPSRLDRNGLELTIRLRIQGPSGSEFRLDWSLVDDATGRVLSPEDRSAVLSRLPGERQGGQGLDRRALFLGDLSALQDKAELVGASSLERNHLIWVGIPEQSEAFFVELSLVDETGNPLHRARTPSIAVAQP